MKDDSQGPNPFRIFETLTAYQNSAALKAAIDTGIFTAIGEGASTPAEIAQACNVSERGARIISDTMTIAGFVSKDDGRYRLTDESAAFLDRRSPSYIGSMADFLCSRELKAGFDNLPEAVRTGGAPETGSTVSADNPIWVTFARGMGPMMRLISQMVAQEVGPLDGGARVLDIAAGHGYYGISIAQRSPQAVVVGLDWQQVLEVARDNARAANLDGRYQTIAGDAFEVDFGSGYDLVLIPNFLHHFGYDANVELLRKVKTSLNEHGRAAIVEFVPNEDRVSPPDSASFSVVMLAGTPSGDAYTYPQLESMVREAGFRRADIRQLGPTAQSLVLAYA